MLLKPCPFCGEPAELDISRGFVSYRGTPGNAVAVYCTSCLADMCMCYEDFPQYTIEELAVLVAEHWNKRATLS